MPRNLAITDRRPHALSQWRIPERDASPGELVPQHGKCAGRPSAAVRSRAGERRPEGGLRDRGCGQVTPVVRAGRWAF
ncbi:MAG: hypothetical protein JWO67_4336 [Streptosporangiaceae bacterium]|nr:hypothetical protein [Streptosporangiaceae bacterium]